MSNWRNVLLGGKPVSFGSSYGASGPWWKNGHTGIDVRASSGTPLRVPRGGTVVQAGWGGPYGNTVVIKMSDGYFLRFAHMTSLGVSKGQTVKAGQWVGTVGSTGNTTGAHLHMEVMKPGTGGRYGAGNFVNPVNYLNGRAGSVTATGPAGSGRSTTSTGSGSGGTTSTTSGGTSGGGSGGIGKVAFTKKDFYAMLSSNFGSIDILLSMDKKARGELGGKSIKWAVDQIVKKKIIDPSMALTYLNKTAWYKKYGVETTQRLINEKETPGVARQNIAEAKAELAAQLRADGVTMADDALSAIARNMWAYGWTTEQAMNEIRKSKAVDPSGKKDEIAAMLNAAGVQLSDAAMEKIAHDAWALGWSDATIVDEVQNLGDGDLVFSGGAIAEATDALSAYADDYGVNLTDADMRQIRMDYLDNLGDQRIKETIQERAAQKYSIFADQIRAGQSVRSLTSAYFDSAAQLLEVDANAIKWDDPLFTGGRAFTTTDPKTGQQVQKGLWDFEKDIRKDSRWMNTKNAQDEVMGKAGGILKMMGLM